jgi:hypothetical protein
MQFGGRITKCADPAALAAEGRHLVVTALAAAQRQDAVSQKAAFDDGVALVLDELRQVGADIEALVTLLHKSA